MTGWWRRRGVRARVVLAAAVLTGVALVVAAVAVVAVFSAGLQHDLDGLTADEVATLRPLVAEARIPAVLPVPAGSTLLAQVLGADQTVQAASPGASSVQPLVGPDQLTRTGAHTVASDSYTGAPLRVRTATVATSGGPVRVVVAAPLTDVRRALSSLRLVLLVVVPLLLVGATASVWWLTGAALAPVERLRSAAAAVADDPMNAGVLPVPPGTDGVARLAGTLAELLVALRSRVVREQAFVADAAHELRSPVASLRVQLDVAAAHPETIDTPALLVDLSADVDRLAALTDMLLTLARADAGAGPRLPIDLAALAGAGGPPVLVAGDADALRRVTQNLLANARKHAGVVQVTVTSDAGWAVLDVDDDGPGIAAADRDRVFDRWVRLDAARATDDGGAGLGLALVRATVRAHGGTVEVADSPLGGARLRVRLPLLAQARRPVNR